MERIIYISLVLLAALFAIILSQSTTIEEDGYATSMLQVLQHQMTAVLELLHEQAGKSEVQTTCCPTTGRQNTGIAYVFFIIAFAIVKFIRLLRYKHHKPKFHLARHVKTSTASA